MMSVAIFAQERVEQRQEWDATVRQYGLAETTIIPDGVTPIPIRTVEELSDLVYKLSLDPIGEVEIVSSPTSVSGASGAAGSSVISNYSCTKSGAISRVKSIVQMTLSLSPTRFKSKGAEWYEVLGVMTLHSIGDVQLNNNIKDGGRRLEMRLNFNVYVGIDRLGYTIPARAKCNYRV